MGEIPTIDAEGLAGDKAPLVWWSNSTMAAMSAPVPKWGVKVCRSIIASDASVWFAHFQLRSCPGQRCYERPFCRTVSPRSTTVNLLQPWTRPNPVIY